MKVSLSWLKDYIDIRMDVADLADALTMAGLEVDSVTDRYAYLHPVLVGRVAEQRMSPRACWRRWPCRERFYRTVPS